MVDLSVKFAGLEFKNPISIASHALFVPKRENFSNEELSEWDMELWGRYYKAGVGAITTGTIFHDEMPRARGGQRFCPINTKGKWEGEGFICAATMPDCTWPRTPGLMALSKAKKKFTDIRIIANIMGPEADPQGWGKLALEAQQAGADAVELNLGSVMMMDTSKKALEGITTRSKFRGGVLIGLVPEVVAKIVKGIKKKANVPVIVKLTPELSFYDLLAALPLYKEAGVDGLTAIHSIITVAPPDIYNRGKTTFTGFDKTTWWALVAGGNRQICYRDVSCIAKYYPDFDVQACGGLVTPEQCIEVMMLGARIVQLSAGIFLNGTSFPSRVIKFLEKYMKEQGYKSVNDFIGLGLNYIVEMEEVQAEFRTQVGNLIAHIDYNKCVGPDNCRICEDTWCVATYNEKGVVKVDPAKCCSCNLCVIRCPHGARSMGLIKK